MHQRFPSDSDRPIPVSFFYSFSYPIHWLIFILLYLLDFLHTVQILLDSHH